jgi:hypothetical protein
MDSFHLFTVEDNISSFSSLQLAMIYLNNYIMKCELKNSEKYNVGDVFFISRSLPSINLNINTRCEIVECNKCCLKVRTLNEVESRFLSIQRSLLRFYVTLEN